MGYIGIPNNLVKVGDFQEENKLTSPYIDTAHCYYCPNDFRPEYGKKDFEFIFNTSNHYYYTHIDNDGQLITFSTDIVQFIKYVNKQDNLLTHDFLNFSIYCNQGKVIEWAQNCIRNYESK